MNISQIQNLEKTVKQQAEECFNSLKENIFSDTEIKKIALGNREYDRMFYIESDNRTKEDLNDFDIELDEEFYIGTYQKAYDKIKKIEVIASEQGETASWGIGYLNDISVVWASEYHNEINQAHYIIAAEGDMFVDNGGQGFTLKNGIWIGEGCEDNISKYPDKNDPIAELKND